MSYDDPAMLAHVDQMRAESDAVIDDAMAKVRLVMALDGDPGLAAVRIAMRLHEMVPADILAGVLGFALVRLARAEGEKP